MRLKATLAFALALAATLPCPASNAGEAVSQGECAARTSGPDGVGGDPLPAWDAGGGRIYVVEPGGELLSIDMNGDVGGPKIVGAVRLGAQGGPVRAALVAALAAPTIVVPKVVKVNEYDQVVLDASGSYDTTPANKAVTFLWAQTSGVAAETSDPTKAILTFTAPLVGSTGGQLTFDLTVTDQPGTGTSKATVIVEVAHVAAKAGSAYDGKGAGTCFIQSLFE